MAAQADFHPIFFNESWHGPSFTYLLAPPVVGLPLRPPPAPCCAVEKCFQNMPPIFVWLIEGHDGPTHDARWFWSIDDAWAVSAKFFFFSSEHFMSLNSLIKAPPVKSTKIELMYQLCNINLFIFDVTAINRLILQNWYINSIFVLFKAVARGKRG